MAMAWKTKSILSPFDVNDRGIIQRKKRRQTDPGVLVLCKGRLNGLYVSSLL